MEGRRRAVNLYVREVEKQIEQAFASEEERARRQERADEFRRARHEDPSIGDLCDQRDQFRELVRLATVPGVAVTLRRELEKVEQELDKLYPGALSVEDKVPSIMLVEELYFLTGPDNLLRIILPISIEVWDGIHNGDTGSEATCAMRMAWEMISGLGLKSSDGEFCFENNCCMFIARDLTADDMTSFKELILQLRNSSSMTFRFSPLPTEVQEAIFS
jgi:hypothetical protein